MTMTTQFGNHPWVTSDELTDIQLENIPVTENCDVVRRKIRALIDNGDMKISEFQNEINVTSKAYSRFMSQHGPDQGSGSSVYLSAWAFFKKREMKGITTKQKVATKADAKKAKESMPNVGDVEIEGEKDDKVPVFDTCDEVRRKINLLLKKPGVTQAAFLKNAAASYHKAPRKLSAAQLSAFRSKKGPYAGNTCGVFYGAYVYFEKQRIKEGKPKSKKRVEMETLHAKNGGIETGQRMDSFLCFGNERPHIDQHGIVKFY